MWLWNRHRRVIGCYQKVAARMSLVVVKSMCCVKKGDDPSVLARNLVGGNGENFLAKREVKLEGTKVNFGDQTLSL
jgi:hypothetical protein